MSTEVVFKNGADVFGWVADVGIEGRFDEIDAVIASLDVNTESIDMLVTWMMATVVNNDRFPSRRDVYERIRDRFVAELGVTETAGILDRLRR